MIKEVSTGCTDDVTFLSHLGNKYIYGSPLIVNLNRILDVNLLNPALDANCQNLVPLARWGGPYFFLYISTNKKIAAVQENYKALLSPKKDHTDMLEITQLTV
jgi:hypothetical protein